MHDPVLIEIIKNAMATIAEEIGIVAVRSAYSTVVKESADASAAVCDWQGQVIAQSLGAPLMHLSSLRWSPRELMKDFPPETMKDGDVFLFNDQFRGGIHSNDIMVFKPVFSGGRPRFLTSALIHVADLGGLSAGGLPATATEYFHEGLMLPPVKLYDGGRLNEDLVRIISSNSRTPEKVMGDIRSMVGGTNVGARRLLELIDKYGLEQLEALVRDLLDYTERLTRSEIAKIPAGTYHGSYVIEDDGIVPDKTYTVRVAVTVTGSDCHFDFTGTDAQARGAINAAFSQAISGMVFALRCFIDPAIPMNEGCFRPLTFTLPLGTMVNPRPPAACNARMATVQAVIDAVFGALSQAFADRAVAASGNVHVYTMNGIDRTTGKIWSFMDPVIGSLGARSIKDGLDGQPIALFGGGDNRPSMEAYEIEYPVMFNRFQFWADSGGPGKWRGGMGLHREVTVLEDAEVTVRAADRCRIPPPGIMGGKPAKGGGWVINAERPERIDLPSKKTNQPLHAGDTLSMLVSGGGGFGDPLERSAELVARDVADGAVSIQAAARDYGVILDPITFKVDAEATAKGFGTSRAPGVKPDGLSLWNKRWGAIPARYWRLVTENRIIMAERSYFVGVDIGGTFTDVVLAEAASNRLFTAKTLTTPDDPGQGVIAAMRDALGQGQATAADIQRVVHATTLATNLILERKGSKVAYITTSGFGDLFVIGKQRVVGADRYDIFLEKSPPLVSRRLTIEVQERINHRGEVVVPFNQHQAVEDLRRLAREDVDAVAICFFHSYANPAHERAMAELVRKHLPGAYVALSSEVWPEFREYERASTTVMSAYVGPTISRYVEALERDLRKMGLTGSFEIMQSSGGVMSAAAVARKPIYSVESGPAAGVVAATYLGQLCNQPNIISFDMGGTTAKAGLIRHGKPSITHDFRVGGHLSAGTRAGGHPIKIPVIDLAEVGAGGGSIAWVDAGGALQVGPLSAGAAPGPACYGFGGEQPTVTDANLLLGYLDPNYFLGGRMRIYPEKSLAAIEPLAKRAGLDSIAAAKGIYEIANTHMGSAVRVVTIQRGVDPREYAVMAFGGAGPVHAVKVAEQFEIPNVIVPISPGLVSALGLLVSDMAEDYVATLLMDSREADTGRIQQLLDQLGSNARAALRNQGVAEADITIQPLIDVRFKHQSHELSVPIPAGPINAATVSAAEEGFRKLYNELYGVLPNDPCQFVNFRVRATGIVPKAELGKAQPGDGNSRRALKGSRKAYFAETGGFVEVSVYDRILLRPGDQVSGPAIMEEPDSTTLCPPGYVVRVDDYLNLHINRG